MQNHQLNVRHSNIELLRIVSMMLIITTHIFGHYVHMKGSCWPLPEGHIFYFTMKSISYIAVNMYIVISAYFLCCSKFKSKRIISIWIEVLFYSVTIWLFNYLLTGELGSPKTMIFAFFPILMNQYWFATVFIGLLILSPFLNIAIRAFTKKQLRLLSLVLFLLFCIIPQCISQVSKWLNMGGGVGITWFVTLYIWASYIRLYISKDYIQYNKYKFLFYGLLASIMPEILRMLIIVSTQVIVGHPMGGGFFYGNNMLFPTIATVLLFMYFLTVKISNKTINKIINKLASSSFAVYLIHDNVYIREMLKDVIPQFIQTNSSWFILQYVFVVFVIWLIATLIDFIRQNLFRPINKYLELRCVDREINKMYDTVD